MTKSEPRLPGTTLRLLPDAQAVAAEAARRIVVAAVAAIAARGQFRIALAGGTTPLAAYRLLADQDADWARWEVFFGDERCLPADDAERNSVAAEQALLGRVAVAPERVFPIPAERGAEAAAEAYEPRIAAGLPLDLALLGIGEDGHTASLFPGHEVPDRLVMPVHHAPKPPPERVSLTPRALGACRELLILVTGAGKADAVARWRDGAALPVAEVAAAAPSLVLMDRAALPG